MDKNELLKSIIAATNPRIPKKKDWRIGCVGAGFIMKDCHLVAYRDMGFNPVAICSLSREESEEVAKRHQIETVYDSYIDLLQDETLEIIDIAIPPDLQLDVVREALKHPNIKGILCQKPLAMSLEDAKEIARLGKEAGVPIAVNSNMRYDQSMRALKYVMDEGYLGKTVLATIEMRAIPHWQEFLKKYDKVELYGMGIHHVDILRYLLGDPQEITAVCRKDPRTTFEHIDGITQYTYKYSDDCMATSLDDVWAWPNEPCEKDIYIKWRLEGLKGMATGTIGWPMYPERCPSTMKFTCDAFPNEWLEPTWDAVWFPDAFRGTMSSLMCAMEDGELPEINAIDNIKTIACVEACYKSIAEKRTVQLKEIYEEE